MKTDGPFNYSLDQIKQIPIVAIDIIAKELERQNRRSRRLNKFKRR